MLIKQTQLQGIKSGKVSLIFRKWTKPRVKKGSIIKTSVGQLEIVAIEQVNPDQISPSEARLAGYHELNELMNELDSRTAGNLFRIQIRYHSPDPRIELRNRTNFTEAEFIRILSRLEKFDKLSRQGPWVMDTLSTINNYPKMSAFELAKKLEKPKDWLKVNIRKLKNLGLTVSHEKGYSLSPRGAALMKQLQQSQSEENDNS